MPWSDIATPVSTQTDREEGASQLLYRIMSMLEQTGRLNEIEITQPDAVAWYRGQQILIRERERSGSFFK